MSILRSATKLGTSVRQCARLVVAAKQQRRGYADMAFTFASPVGVCIYLHSAFDILDRRLRFGLRVLELCSFIAHPVSLSSTQEFRAVIFRFKKCNFPFQKK